MVAALAILFGALVGCLLWLGSLYSNLKRKYDAQNARDEELARQAARASTFRLRALERENARLHAQLHAAAGGGHEQETHS